MSDKNKTAENRRKLLKTVAAGGGAIIAGKTLPENWARPAVESVVLPAHARTSMGPFSGTMMASLDSDSLLARAVDSLVPNAHADNPDYYDFSWCITPDPGGTKATVDILVLHFDGSDDVCEAELCSAENVPVGVKTNLTCNPACSTDVDAGKWLDNLGLVKEAKASDPASVTLNGLMEGDTFDFYYPPATIDEKNITLNTARCGPKSAVCDGDCPT